MSISTDMREKRAFVSRWIGWWLTTTLPWMTTTFLIAFASAVAALAIFGVGERGTAIALRLTARWSFFLFWLAYAGSAMARVFGSRFARLARRGRDFGLGFASAQAVHVGLVLWLFYLAPGSNGGMVFFWIGILGTYLLALISLPRIHDTLGPSLWLTLRMVAIEYIALVFAADFLSRCRRMVFAVRTPTYWRSGAARCGIRAATTPTSQDQFMSLAPAGRC